MYAPVTGSLLPGGPAAIMDGSVARSAERFRPRSSLVKSSAAVPCRAAPHVSAPTTCSRCSCGSRGRNGCMIGRSCVAALSAHTKALPAHTWINQVAQEAMEAPRERTSRPGRVTRASAGKSDALPDSSSCRSCVSNTLEMRRRTCACHHDRPAAQRRKCAMPKCALAYGAASWPHLYSRCHDAGRVLHILEPHDKLKKVLLIPRAQRDPREQPVCWLCWHSCHQVQQAASFR